MSVLAQYARQDISWQVYRNSTAYGTSGYSTAINIKVRWEYRQRKITSPEGAVIAPEQTMSTAIVYTESAINVNDLLTFDGKAWKVLAVAIRRDLLGNEVYREVLV